MLRKGELLAQGHRLVRSNAMLTPHNVGFPKQEYWSDLAFPFPGDLPHSGIEPGSPALQTDSLRSEPPGKLVLQIREIPDSKDIFAL